METKHESTQHETPREMTDEQQLQCAAAILQNVRQQHPWMSSDNLATVLALAVLVLQGNHRIQQTILKASL
ncbi:MAG: hypothetical protein U5L02_16460 [Rheinheimera sp.]|nr:hypothetical protein [Rheinheimera sp.]